MQTVFFKPVDTPIKEPLRISGKVIDVHYRLSTTEKDGWPPLSYMSSKVGGLILRKDMKASVEIVFSAHRPANGSRTARLLSSTVYPVLPLA